VDKPVFRLSNDFPGDKEGTIKYCGSSGEVLLLAGLLLGGLRRKRGLGNREYCTHGSLQPIKWGLWCWHDQHNITSMMGDLQ
jgi:hypothetical protein